MDVLHHDISVGLVPSKYVRFHSFSVENTLLRQHPAGAGARPKEEEQKWRGDHTFSSDAASFSLLNFIEPEIEAANPHLSKTEVHNQALEKFEIRLKQDLAFEHKENSHVDTTVHWTVVENMDGKKELATQYGGEMITLSKLWDHTRTYAEHIGNPLAYNKEEERAQLLMQDAFIEGKANGFVSVISHPDAIRYVQVWERTNDGDISSKQIDLYATTGRDFTHTEGQALVVSITKYHEGHGTSTKDTNVQYEHALFTSGNTTVDDVRIIAVAHTISDYVPVVSTSVDMMRAMSLKTMKDIQETTMVLGRDFQTYMQKKIAYIKSLGEHPRESKKDTVVEEGTHAIKTDIFREISARHIETSIAADATETHNIVFQDVLSEWVFDQTVLSLGASHEVFSQSALMMLVLEPRIELHTDASMAERAENIHVLKEAPDQDVRMTIESVLTFLQKIFATHRESPRGFTFKKSTDTGVSDIDLFIQELLGKDADVSVEKIESGIVVIMTALSFLASESGYSGQMPRKEDGKRVDLLDLPDGVAKEDVIKIADSRAMLGIVVWMILQGFDRSNTQSIHDDMSLREVVHDEQEGHEAKELFSTTPWVLLSIIWHLSMAKEAQLTHHTQVAIKGKKSKSSPNLAFPLSGVVYLYVRDRISIDTHSALSI